MTKVVDYSRGDGGYTLTTNQRVALTVLAETLQNLVKEHTKDTHLQETYQSDISEDTHLLPFLPQERSLKLFFVIGQHPIGSQ